jgi:hypothetical protein
MSVPASEPTPMRDITNRTFDEIEVGVTKTISRTLTATAVLKLVAHERHRRLLPKA